MFFAVHPSSANAKSQLAFPAGLHNFGSLDPLTVAEDGAVGVGGDWLLPTVEIGFRPTPRIISRYAGSNATGRNEVSRDISGAVHRMRHLGRFESQPFAASDTAPANSIKH